MVGVYQFKNDKGEIIYVGKAKNLRHRVSSYFQSSKSFDIKTKSLVQKIKDIEFIVTDNEIESLILEANLIKQIKPHYNVVLKDDKSYPYIAITDEPFPQVFVTRKKNYEKWIKYFGPFTDVSNLKLSLKIIRDVFKVRSCKFYLDEKVVKSKKVKLCLDYQIKKCDGPCEGLISEKEYNENINRVKKILQRKSFKVIEQLKSEMDENSNNLNFEKSLELRNKINSLQIYFQKQKIFSSNNINRDIIAIAVENKHAVGIIFKIRDGKFFGKQNYLISNATENNSQIMEQLLEQHYLSNENFPNEIFLSCEVENENLLLDWLSTKTSEKIEIQIPKIGDKAKLVQMCEKNAKLHLEEVLQKKVDKKKYILHEIYSLQRDLRFKKLPIKIECFDISHLQGSDTVASLIVFENGKPKKNEYRKFKIKTVSKVDDFLSMKEVVFRRYKTLLDEKKEVPDLILIDGGKGQLSSAKQVLDELNLDIPIISLAKKLEEIFLPNQTEAILIPRTSSSLKLLQKIRDEAHRFAITFHKLLRSARTIQTELTNVLGIGKKRAELLLQHFDSIENITKSSIEELSKIVGKKNAKNLLNYFKKN